MTYILARVSEMRYKYYHITNNNERYLTHNHLTSIILGVYVEFGQNTARITK